MNEFERKVYSLLKKQGFTYRFPDSTIIAGKGYRRISSPCDFLFLRNGECYFIEAKSVDTDKFPLKNISENQIKFAEKITSNGGQYIFLIEIINEIFFISYQDLIGLGKKNLHIKDLREWKFIPESL